MRLRLEPRTEAPLWLVAATPVFAVLLTLVLGALLFLALGYPPLEVMKLYFVTPISDGYGVAELFVKASPIMLCALGLMFCFRAGVWNIGAEGQLAIGAVVGSAVALSLPDTTGPWILPVMLVMGAVGGMAWAAIPAFLKTRFGANEILTSLMLVYVATLLLSAMVHGPLRDPYGFNFPQSRTLQDAALLPILIEGTRFHAGIALGFVILVVTLVIHARHEIGFGVRLMGMAPKAAVHGGFSRSRMTWGVLLGSGALAGLAGILEVTGPIERLLPSVSPGYGFTAIIVAFLGRLHPIGVMLASFIMALSYLGGELAQVILKVPNAVTGVFQGVLLFTILGCDLFVRYRIRVAKPMAAASA